MGLSDFEILSKIGEGSFSSVWRVKRISDGQEYALKKVKLLNLSPKEKQNSVNEVRILASIQQPNVIGYKEVFLEENSTILCIVMEYAGGGDIYQKIQQYEKNQMYFKEQEVWSYAVQMILGLKALHRMKILHRDFKSANIFLSKDGKEAKIGDLNVSKILKSQLSYTQTGTPYYASPEVWRDQPYDMKSDIWSLGCVIYEIATLKTPFRAKDMDGLYKKVQKGTFNRIPIQYSDDLMSLISMCLKLTATQRPTCEDLLRHPLIVKNCQWYLKSIEDAPFTKDTLLETIRVPKNMRSLGSLLPKPNYMRERVNTESATTADIRKIHQRSEINLKNYMSLGNESISRSIPSETDYASAKVESSIIGSKLGNIVRAKIPEHLPRSGSSGNLYAKVRKIKVDDFSMPKEVSLHSENNKYLKPANYKFLVAKRASKNSQQQGDSKRLDSAEESSDIEVKKRSFLNPNMRSKSTVTGISDPEKPRRSIAGPGDISRIALLESGKGMKSVKDMFPQKIFLKPTEFVSSHRNQNSIAEEEQKKNLMDKVLDEIAPVQKANVVILRHKVPKRAINNKSAMGVGRHTEGSYMGADSTKDLSGNVSSENPNIIPLKKYILRNPSSDAKSNPRLRKSVDQPHQLSIQKLSVSRESSEVYMQKKRQRGLIVFG